MSHGRTRRVCTVELGPHTLTQTLSKGKRKVTSIEVPVILQWASSNDPLRALAALEQHDGLAATLSNDGLVVTATPPFDLSRGYCRRIGSIVREAVDPTVAKRPIVIPPQRGAKRLQPA